MSDSDSQSTKEALRIAVVEDDKVLLSLLEKLLRKQEDFEFVGAWASPEDALEDLPASKPDLVIVDYELPVMSGVDLIRRITPLLPETSFVVLTIHSDADHVFSALRGGASGYLVSAQE